MLVDVVNITVDDGVELFEDENFRGASIVLPAALRPGFYDYDGSDFGHVRIYFWLVCLAFFPSRSFLTVQLHGVSSARVSPGVKIMFFDGQFTGMPLLSMSW